MASASGKLGQQRLAIGSGVIGVVLLKQPEICQEAKSLVILSGMRLLKTAHGRNELHDGLRYILKPRW
jgi:hypothetical protein